MEAILQAAAHVFERYGYAAGTTNRIAVRAGVSIGSLYQYFPNKDAILVALVRDHFAEGLAMLAPHFERLRSGEPLDAVIPDVVVAMISLHAITPKLHRILFEETPLPQALRSEIDASEDMLVEMIAAALDNDIRISPADRPLAARIILICVEGLTHRLVLRPPPGATDALIATEVTIVVRSYLDSLAGLPVG